MMKQIMENLLDVQDTIESLLHEARLQLSDNVGDLKEAQQILVEIIEKIKGASKDYDILMNKYNILVEKYEELKGKYEEVSRNKYHESRILNIKEIILRLYEHKELSLNEIKELFMDELYKSHYIFRLNGYIEDLWVVHDWVNTSVVLWSDTKERPVVSFNYAHLLGGKNDE